MWAQFPVWEDPLEKEMATHSSILAWEIPWTEEPGVQQSIGLQRVGHDLATQQQKQQIFPIVLAHCPIHVPLKMFSSHFFHPRQSNLKHCLTSKVKA